MGEPQLFESVPASKTGVDFVNQLNSESDLSILDYLYYYNGGGIAVGDINNDGLPDIFLTANQGKNKLFLNKGNFSFEDISATAQIEGKSSWNTGATMADVNGDGWLDIYVCAVVGINGFVGHNELFINNGDNTFSERSEQFQLNTQSYSSSAAFLDYDLDGDLDVYVLNHAVHTQNSYGHSNLRLTRNPKTGDQLFRNDQGKFVDVSHEAGIYGGVNSYGLGLATADFNQDGYPDIFIGNDFHEDDYLYINNQDGTFSESLREWTGHTSRFSMGSDVADINHDGWPDLISLDMLPKDEKILKESEGDDNIQTQKMRVKRYGYHYQFTRNMLFVNLPGAGFMETALMSGVAATDWSWSALFADFNNDSEQDLFISNGIPKRPNNLDFIKFVSNDQIKNKITNTKLVDRKAIDLMPSGAHQNFIFKGTPGINFIDQSATWLPSSVDVSGASAYADLDSDGDLDLIINNLNQNAQLYRNRNNGATNYLQLELRFKGQNSMGIGTKVYSYHNGGLLQFKSLYTSKGFQGSSEPLIHFGYQNSPQVDSLIIVWPDHTTQKLTNIPTNQRLNVKYSPSNSWNPSKLRKTTRPIFKKIDDGLGINYIHQEDNYVDFNREKLIPYKASDRGPALATGDLNGDGTTDLFFGSSKLKPAQIFLQLQGKFKLQDSILDPSTGIKEITTALIADLNNDQRNDLFAGAGGGDFSGNSSALKDYFLIFQDSTWVEQTLPDYFENASVVQANDYDSDGDLDLFVGNHMVTGKFGMLPKNYLLINDGTGKFSIDLPDVFQDLGMITDAKWVDLDGDGTSELWVVGEWMSPEVFSFQEGKFKKKNWNNRALKGLWQSMEIFDIDLDGDPDILLGNWGLNSKFKANFKSPLRLYFNDFDDNGQTESILAISKNGAYYPIHSIDELTLQLQKLRKGFQNYKDYAGLTLEEIFSKQTLEESSLLEVSELRSGYLRNEGGKFTFIPFMPDLQQSPLMAFVVEDFLNLGNPQVLTGGNYFGVKPYHGRFDSFPGALIIDENQQLLTSDLGLNFKNQSVRELATVSVGDQKLLLVVFNDAAAELYQY